MNENTIRSLKYIYLFAILQLYLIGFFLRENLAGGAENDFILFTWPAIEAFKNNFFITLKNYGTFGEGSTPLFHILNAYLNPFTFSQIGFQASITFLSLLNVLFFSQILKEKYKFDNLNSLFYSSVFLILPFFRSSAFWGITENLGWLFLILSIKYFIRIEKNDKSKNYSIFLLCLFSSLALYTRPYLVFFPIFVVLYSIFYGKKNLLKHSIIFYFLFSLPGLYLLYIWGGVLKIGISSSDQVSLMNFHHPKFILKNVIIFASIFVFYFVPLGLSKYLNSSNFLKKKDFFIFLLIFIILIILSFFNFFDYLNYEKLGGGAFLKLNQILFENFLIPFFFISAVGIMFILKFATISNKNTLLFISLLIFCFPKFILQEYFEPLFLILFLTLIDFKENNIKLLKKNKTQFIYLIFFLTYLTSSFFYRYHVNPI